MNPIIVNGPVSINDYGVSHAREDSQMIDVAWLVGLSIGFDNGHRMVLDLKLKLGNCGCIDDAEAIAFPAFNGEDGTSWLWARGGSSHYYLPIPESSSVPR